MRGRVMGHNRSAYKPLMKGFEWWYVHAVGDSFFATFTAHVTDIVGNRLDGCYLSIVVVSGNLHVEERVGCDITCDSEGYLHVSEFLIEDSSGWVIKAGSESFEIVLRVARAGTPWRIGHDSILFASAGRSAHWSVPMPFASFSGQVEIKGRRHKLDGWAYQDHNWGTALMHEEYSGWTWQAISGPCGAHIFADLHPGRSIGRRIGIAVGRDGRSPYPLGAYSSRTHVDLKRRRYVIKRDLVASYSRVGVADAQSPSRHYGVHEEVKYLKIDSSPPLEER